MHQKPVVPMLNTGALVAKCRWSEQAVMGFPYDVFYPSTLACNLWTGASEQDIDVLSSLDPGHYK